MTEFVGEDIYNGRLQEYLNNYDDIIGHNICEYDVPALRKLAGIVLSDDQLVDTLVLSRLHWQARPDGHSLESWGKRLKFEKAEFNDFSRFSPEMVSYCRKDVLLTAKIYNYLMERMPWSEWGHAIETELAMANIVQEMHTRGFAYNMSEAAKIEAEITEVLAVIDEEINKTFLPKLSPIREVTPRLTKYGTISKVGLQWYEGNDYSQFSAESPFTLCEWVPFNPGSPKQVIERLNQAGWKPVEKTKGHIKAEKEKLSDRLEYFKEYGWTLSERNLATLPETAPEAARLLVKRALLSARLRTLTEWRDNYNPQTGSVHGTFDPLGTWTHRFAHRKPNLGNVAAKKSIKYNSPELKHLAIDLGGRMRALWRTRRPDGHLVSVDMDAAHLRIFAHLVKDKDLAEAIDNGDKDLGTDVHTMNMKKLGGACPDRDRSKTFVYTFLNGGAAPKVASIFDVTLTVARKALGMFVDSFPVLKDLRTNVFPQWERRGYFIGIDGRKVACTSAHQMMAGILQNYEAVLIKETVINSLRRIEFEIDCPVFLVNIVHDEILFDVLGSEAEAEAVGRIVSEEMAKVGQSYNLLCPLVGKPHVGKTWLDVH